MKVVTRSACQSVLLCGRVLPWSRLGLWLSGGILLILGCAKIANGAHEVVGKISGRDPVFGLKISHLFITVGVAELMGGFICLFVRRSGVSATVLAWFATNLVLYRAGVYWIAGGRPCQCMAGIATYLTLTPEVADRIMLCVLALFLGVGYGVGFRHWKN
ncbi:MAG: hypothetical protein HY735_18320 [Verrucomicrobia bacterium]|nr:hypothetical protein [Verrucomicrobiota bacterium]